MLPYDHGESARHFALTDALVRHVERPTVWWHSADSPTLILGAGQAALPSAPTGIRRQAGGTAVYAARDVLGLDIALPVGHPLVLSDVVEAYRWLGETWVDALARLEISAHLVSVAEARAVPAPTGELGSLVAAACFGTLSPYEVTVGDRKLVGLAQVRRRAGVLFESGVHLHFDAHSLASALAPQHADRLAAELRLHAAGLHEAAHRPLGFQEVMTAFNSALCERFRVKLGPGVWRDSELKHADRSDAWRTTA